MITASPDHKGLLPVPDTSPIISSRPKKPCRTPSEQEDSSEVSVSPNSSSFLMHRRSPTSSRSMSKVLLASLLVLCSAFSPLHSASAASKTSNTEKRVVCYYTNWSAYRQGPAKFLPDNINPYLCTHLVYAFGGLTSDSGIKPFDKYQDIDKGGYTKFNGLKTYNKALKTMIAIGGWNEGSRRFSSLVAEPEKRKTFIKHAIRFLRQYQFDGLDLDWEYPASREGGVPEDKANYAQFIKELREAFEEESKSTGRSRLLLTVAVPAGIEWIQKGFDIPTINSTLSEIDEERLLGDEDDMGGDKLKTPDEVEMSVDIVDNPKTPDEVRKVQQAVGELEVAASSANLKFPTPTGSKKHPTGRWNKKSNDNTQGRVMRVNLDKDGNLKTPNKKDEGGRVKRTMVSPGDSSTQPPNKKRLTEDQVSDMITVVKKNDEDDPSISVEDYKKFQVALRKKVAGLHGTKKIKIRRVYLKDARVSVCCVDEDTKKWLENSVQDLDENFFAIDNQELVKVSFFVYGDDMPDGKEFIQTIEEQNDVDVSGWSFLKVIPQKAKKGSQIVGHLVVVNMLEEFYTVIHEKPLYFLIGEIKAKLWDKPKKKIEDKIAVAEQGSKAK